jgi:NO-binding membrane sensor protein with MHYT domain
MVTVHNFSYGLLNPVLGYIMSCLGAFIGLRCVTRARAHTGTARLRWLAVAAVALGAAGIWAMHFIAMLGFTIPGQAILYNVPITIVSMLIVIAVVGVGLYIVCNGNGGWRPLTTGGVIVGIGVVVMHYLGMAAISMPDTMRYNIPLFVMSVVIAMVAGTAALWAGTQVRGIGTTIGASLIMGVAVSGMHYTGMAAMHVYPDAKGTMTAMGGASATSFLIPLLAGISLLTFALTLTISLSPTEDEIHEDALLRQRMDTEFGGGLGVRSAGTVLPAPAAQATGRVAPRADAFTPGGYSQGTGYSSNGNGNDQVNGYQGGQNGGGDRAAQPPLPMRGAQPPLPTRGAQPTLPTRRSPRNADSSEVPPRDGT